MPERLILWIMLILFPAIGSGQSVRAVWVATAHRIDFPKTNGVHAQQAELRELLDRAVAGGLNTLIFQVRGRGDAAYASEFEPWSDSFSGRLGEYPGWDPLAFVLAEGQKRGLRVIAWFNVFKVADATSPTDATGPRKHPSFSNPGWILRSGGEQFLNPGIPAVREYLGRVIGDLTSKYAVDGVQLDFIRYPTGSYDDASTLKKYKSRSQPDGDFRRMAVSETVRILYETVKSVRPETEFSAAPLGIWKAIPGAQGLESYHDVYQDSQGWVKSGWMDAIYPQIYWPAGGISDGINPKPAPDFDILIGDWVKNCAPIPVVAGIGIYKPVVFKQAGRLEASATGLGAAGVSFYSWSQFRDLPVGQPVASQPSANPRQQPDSPVQFFRLTGTLGLIIFIPVIEKPVRLISLKQTGDILAEEIAPAGTSHLIRMTTEQSGIRVQSDAGTILFETTW